MDEQLVDTDSNKKSSEIINQKMNLNYGNKEYHVFTSQYDEIAKADTVESNEEILKLR